MNVQETVAAYMESWNEIDPAKRAELLNACWEDEAVFQDGMGKAEGRQGLIDYIGKAQNYMPGLKLELGSPAEEVRGYVRFGWLIRKPDGDMMAKGTNFGQLSPAGKLLFVTGFWDR